MNLLAWLKWMCRPIEYDGPWPWCKHEKYDPYTQSCPTCGLNERHFAQGIKAESMKWFKYKGHSYAVKSVQPYIVTKYIHLEYRFSDNPEQAVERFKRQVDVLEMYNIKESAMKAIEDKMIQEMIK